jgi:UDP-2,3-diacylglucosamine pyrophosphatase LpxH
MTKARRIYVISDLHIGGSYADDQAPRDERKRGFRMMTRVKELTAFVRKLAALPDDPPVELVINGDFIDFLAEERGAGQGVDPDAAPAWTAFRFAQGEALAAFQAVVERDKILFDALKQLLKAGKRLTVLLGNHDIEMCLPDVRAAFEAAVGPGALRFIDDGQALDLGEVLIDHGNLFDPANVVDHEQLRLVRSVYSRGRFAELDGLFSPPAGSRLVAEVMNPIKVAYGFIDLLKPESEPLFALLLALEPSYRNILDDAASALAHAARTLVPRRGLPWSLRNVSAEPAATNEPAPTLLEVGAGEPAPSALDLLVADVLANESGVAAALAAEGKDGQVALEEVAAGGFLARWSLFRLLTGRDKGELELDRRIPQVQATLRVLVGDTSFVRSIENKRYLEAAQSLATEGLKPYKVVVFGHTHHAKALTIPGTEVRYFNTGTWANLMRFPDALLDPTLTAGDVRAELFAFAKQLEKNQLDVVFNPTYVRLDLGADGALQHAQLYDYDWKNDRLPDLKS